MSKVNKVNELISLRKKKKKKISQPRKKKKNERKYTYHSEKLKNFKFWRQNIIRLHTHICVHRSNYLIQDEDQFNSIYIIVICIAATKFRSTFNDQRE